jgi:N-acetylmuramic acid 6-phosphate etherase
MVGTNWSIPVECEPSVALLGFQSADEDVGRCEDAGATHKMNERDPNFDRLVTETQPGGIVPLDLMTTIELIELMNREDANVPGIVALARDQTASAIDGIAARLNSGGRLTYVGAGTSGRLAVLDATECGPTFGVGPKQIQAVLAGGEAAMMHPAEGIEDDAGAGAADLRARSVTARDAIVGVSASGRTPYVLGALEHARREGALTVGLVCNPSSPIASQVDLPIEILTGPEVIGGSTRLKAGTAQKLALNMISTITMVRLGRTFGNLMVDVRTSNEKLRLRALRIIRLATDCSDDEAYRALDAAGGEAKIAILMVLTGDTPTAAAEKLKQHDGHLRSALGSS